ncbi:MAG: hypothetical protein COB85_08645, partial [Bacteroidetes bacterium]
GSAGVTAAGGTSPYTYLWNDPDAQTTASATGLCNGTYSVAITDLHGCNAIGLFAIIDPLPMTAISASTDVTCFGDCDGTATSTASNGTSPYTYNWDDFFTQATQVASNLCAGPYSVTITDQNGCFTTSSTVVGTPDLLIIAISSSGNVSCNGGNDGFAQSTVSGGVGSYTYLWSDGQTGAQAINLVADIYDVTVTDGNGCTAVTTIVITEPQGMGVTTSQVNVSCYDLCDGSIVLSVGGGTPPYTYQWNDPGLQTSSTATGLCFGVFGVTITDNKSCIITTSVIITQPQQLGLFETITPSTCGASNGGACVNVIGGCSPYVIIWDDPLTTVGSCITNVPAGAYNPIVTDCNGCFFTKPVVINDITGPVIDTLINTDVTCNGDSNGTATVAATGVTPPLTYVWKYGADTIASGIGFTTVFNLWGGTFSITIIDANGCIAGSSITIDEPGLMSAAVISYQNVSCNGLCDGTANLFVGGGIPPYTYAWQGGQTTSSVTGLCAGTHNVVIYDANGCSTTASANITEPDQLVILDSVNDASCSGDSDGSIYITMQGGTPFYSYGWTPIGTGSSNIVTNLVAQVYTVTVVDIKQCVVSKVITVNEPLPLASVVTSTPSFCTDPNGVGTITPNGGTAPYTYLWPDNDTGATVSNLVAGVTYDVVVTDANGCTEIVSVSVTDNPGPMISLMATDVDCYGEDDGTATVTIDSLGTTPFTYLWSDPLPQSTATAVGLVGDNLYSVTVTDNFGCTANGQVFVNENDSLGLITSDSVIICTGQSVEISATGFGGFGVYVFEWTPNLGTGSTYTVNPDTTTTYTVEVVDEYGCRSSIVGSITVEVRPPIEPTVFDLVICEGEDIVLSVSVTGGLAPYDYIWSNGFTGSEQTLSGIMNDSSFFVTVSDLGSCSPDSSVQVNVLVHPNPDVDFTISGSGCEPSVLAVYVSPGADPVNLVTWFWDFDDGATSNDEDSTTHTYTSAGTYYVMLAVMSDKGCVDTVYDQTGIVAYETPTAGFIIQQVNIPLPHPHETSILSPTVDFQNTASLGADSIMWDFGDGTVIGPGMGNSIVTGSSNTSGTYYLPSHTYADTGVYYITQWVYTPNGCLDMIVDTLHIYGEYILFAPSAFTPNGDEDNEYFMPKGIGVVGEEFEMYIYDRWGDQIAKITGVWSDDPSVGWDGHANNGKRYAQMDVYVWLIRTKDFRGGDHEYVGHVTLLK